MIPPRFRPYRAIDLTARCAGCVPLRVSHELSRFGRVGATLTLTLSPGGEREARNELFFLRLAGEGGFDARRRQGHAAHAHTDGVEHGIADRGRYRRGGGFARAERLVLRTADHVDLEHRRVGEGDDRIAPPIDA